MNKYLGYRIASFRRDERGNVAMTFALALLPLSFFVSASIDFARLNDRKSEVQNAVDSAVLAALENAAGGTPSDAQVRASISAAIGKYTDIILPQGTASTVNGATALVASNGSTCTYTTTVTPQTSTCANTTITYVSGSPSTYTATVSGTIALPLWSSIAGTTPLNITATADVASSSAPSSTQFQLTNASGWYAKVVNLYVHNKNATSDTLLASYTYTPNNLSQSNSFTGGGGIGNVVASFSDGTTTTWDNAGNVVSGTNEAVSLGTLYDNAYLTMAVYTDGCPAGLTPDPRVANSSFACVASGTSFTSSNSSSSQFANDTGNMSLTNTSSSTSTGTCYSNRQGYYSCQTTTYTYTWRVTKQATAVVYSTQDPLSANHLFVMNANRASVSTDDMPLGTNLPISLFTMIPCGKTVYHSWEDTPWSASQAYTGTWAAQDIYFKVTGTVCSVNANYTNGAPGGKVYLAN